ncbi:hypothetical protein BOTBODRAFT_305674 [Botryobasidium botryosum FD-172 SS1]|uniref:Ribonuclease H1 N-terminal domain-containing protein n=1 Tax=Botryobasidium botryosum (strain FD-172 SS1) TaxID=930990 RepID=A0A067MXR7_BOTB1|nr:hypothetical protein BOTBODRAFT_305674 [Botryobasidium botryosum FD-172 SS1]
MRFPAIRSAAQEIKSIQSTRQRLSAHIKRPALHAVHQPTPQPSMAKSKKPVYYAVRIGREGPKIYNTWDECLKNVGLTQINLYKFESPMPSHIFSDQWSLWLTAQVVPQA